MMDFTEFRSISYLAFNVVLRLCRLSFYGQLLEHLVLPCCPVLLFVHCYCTLWANTKSSQVMSSLLF